MRVGLCDACTHGLLTAGMTFPLYGALCVYRSCLSRWNIYFERDGVRGFRDVLTWAHGLTLGGAQSAPRLTGGKKETPKTARDLENEVGGLDHMINCG
eukprot:40855-Eustigmatos_ZCMA.PRE.1